MKISKKDQKTLLYIIGILMVVAVYFLYYSNKQTEIEALQSEVDTLYSEVMELREYEINNARYKKSTQEYYEKIDSMVSEFPGGIKEETSIMYSRELENTLGVKTGSVNMAPAALLSSFGVGERQKHLYSSTVTMSVSGNYEQIKQMIEGIQNYEDKRTITSMSFTYNRATGNLSGSMIMNLYALSGKDIMYEKPNTGQVQHGTSNIFGQ